MAPKSDGEDPRLVETGPIPVESQDRDLKDTSPELRSTLKEPEREWAEGTETLPTPEETRPIVPLSEPAQAGSDRGRRASASARAEFCELHFHAAGALGEVYTARDATLHREVALKFIRPERADEADSRRRFLREAEVTGRLEHPGVVPIYAVGADPDGSPCYAMRLIRGATLQEAVDDFHAAEASGRDPSERSLAQRALLDRFVSICNTMAYAHARGILHRDLKPGNVMVGRFDETLVVDWGLARPFHRGGAPDPLGEEALVPLSGNDAPGAGSATVGTVGTLGYMSPEQAEGHWENVGPASDVFALGAILYAIVTGRAPYRGRTFAEVLEKVRRCDFPAPRRVKAGVPRALEAICLRAMSPRPEGRYATASDLAADVRRWLADEPVAALRESILDRARRWARRHRTLVIAAAAALAIGLAGLAGVSALLAGKNQELDRERRRAERREALAIEAVRKFRDAVQSNVELRNRAELGPLRKALLQEPLGFFRELKDELRSDGDARPEALSKLADASRELAITTEELGSVPDAIRSYRDAIDILERLAERRPDAAADLGELAANYQGLARLLGETARPDEAMAAYRRALAIREKLARRNPGDAGAQSRLASALDGIGILLQETGRLDESMEYRRRALAIRERVASEHPEDDESRSALAGTHNNLGLLLQEMGRGVGAMESFRRSLAIREQMAAEHPEDAEYQADLAGIHHNLGLLIREQEGPAAALDSFRRELAIRERMVREAPSMTEYRSDLAHALNGTGAMLDALGRKDEALELHRRARAIRERLVEENPDVTEHRNDLARSLVNIASLLDDTGHPEEALETLARALAIHERLVREHPSAHFYRFGLGGTLNDMAAVEMDLGRWRPAREHLVEAIASLRAALADLPESPRYLLLLDRALRKMVRVQAALGSPVDAIRTAEERAAMTPGDPGVLYDNACLLALGVPMNQGETRRILSDEAVRSLKQAITSGWDDAVLTCQDTDLDALRGRDDFRRLLAALLDRHFPIDPFAH